MSTSSELLFPSRFGFSMDAFSGKQRLGRRPSTKLEDLLVEQQPLAAGLTSKSNHGADCASKSLKAKKPRSSSSLNNLTGSSKSSKKKGKKKDHLDRHSPHQLLTKIPPLRRQNSEKLIELFQDTPTTVFTAFSLTPPTPKSRIISSSKRSNRRNSLCTDLSEHSRTNKELLHNESSRHSRKSITKLGRKTSRRNSLHTDLSEHSRTKRTTLDDTSRHSKKSGKAGKKSSSSSSRRKSLTDIPNPLDRFFHKGKDSSKNQKTTSKEGDQSDSNTVETTPSTPFGMKRTLDIKSQLTRAFENANLDGLDTQTIHTISEESPLDGNISRNSSKKQYKRDSSSKKPSSKKDISNKKTSSSKDKKKSKKDKKQKKSKASKEKEGRKTPKKAKSGSLSKHFGSNRSIGSLSSQRSFGSQRSLGSYVSECPTHASNQSFVSFVSVSVRGDELGNSNHSRRGSRMIRKRMVKGSRKAPLVSMPEYSMSPDASRKTFNDNASSHTTRSFSNHTFKSQRYGIPISPGHLVDTPKKQSSQLSGTMTPTTVESSSFSSSLNTTAAESSSSNGNPTTPTSKSKFQMVPKSQSFSTDPIARWSPDFPKRMSPPSCSERGPGSRSISSSLVEMPSESLPNTSFCSAPQATHPNEAVASAWACPFKNIDIKYTDSEEYNNTVANNKFFTKKTIMTPSSKGSNGSSKGKEKLAIKTKTMPNPNLTVKKPPSEAFDQASECSEDSEIDDQWENYTPAALMRNTDQNHFNSSSANSNSHDSSKRSLAYSDDDISALTMSMRTDGSSLIHANSPIGRNPKHTISSSSRQQKEHRVRPRSPTQPMFDDDRSERERFMKDFNISGTEGSISLHDCSERSSRAIDKVTSTQMSSRRGRNPTVPRMNTPPRIRFGEGNSVSPRPKDQSPLLPRRRVSTHDRNDSNERASNTVLGIPLCPKLFDSRDNTVDDTRLGDIEETTSRTDEDENDEETKSLSHGVCDDADAAAGNPAPPRTRYSSDNDKKSKKNKKDRPVPLVPTESFSTHSNRVGALIESFEALDGHRKRSPSPSARKRPLGLQPMLPSDILEVMSKNSDASFSNHISRSPSLPVLTTKSPVARAKLIRKDSDPVNISSRHKKERRNKKNRTKVMVNPIGLKSPKKMAVKLSKKSSKDNLTNTVHSNEKEIICGTSSDWKGAPKKKIRDASYHNEDDNGEDGTNTKKKKGSKSSSKKDRGVRRRSSEGGIGSGDPLSSRRRSMTPTKLTKKKSSDDIATDSSAVKSPVRRRRSMGKPDRKPEKKRTTSRSPRRRSRTPEHKYGRGSKVKSGDESSSSSPRKKKLSKSALMMAANAGKGSSSAPTTPIGGLQNRVKSLNFGRSSGAAYQAPATVGGGRNRGRERGIRASSSRNEFIPGLPLTPISSSHSRSPSRQHRSRKSRSPGRNASRKKTSTASASLSCSRSPGRRSQSRSKSPTSNLPCPPRNGLFRKAKKKKKMALDAIDVDDNSSNFQQQSAFPSNGIKA